jgi:hypothetical protein
MNLKRDSAYEHLERDHDTSKESDTDEKLLAMLFYCSMFSDKRPILISKDSDFKSLLRVIPGLMGAKEFAPDNSLFELALRRNPFDYYHREEEGNLKKFISGSEVTFHNNFDAEEDYSKNEKLGEKIRILWRNFAAISEPIVISHYQAPQLELSQVFVK